MRRGTPGTSGHLSACGHAQAGVTAKSSIHRGGVLCKSGVYAWNDLCLTLGGLPVVRRDWESGNRLRAAGRSQQRA